MKQYHDLLGYIMEKGVEKIDRTGVGTKSCFGYNMRFNMKDGFPIVTTKYIHFKSVVYELLWMIRSDTNIEYLRANGVTIWDEWANENGDLGPVYGKQWRDGFSGIDQLQLAINTLKKDPYSRRIIVSAWNPSDIPKMALAPCHCFFQFNTRPMTIQERLDNSSLLSENWNGNAPEITKILDSYKEPKLFLDLQLYQRSADSFLGVPFNIASYSLLLHMVAQVVKMVPGEFIHVIGDAHIYNNHFDQVREQLSRHPYCLPKLELVPHSFIDDYDYSDVKLVGYKHHPAIKAPIAV